jgi:hypothetical protein
VLRSIIGLVTIISFAGCEKQSGEAIVLAKEHIAAAASETLLPFASRSHLMAEVNEPLPADLVGFEAKRFPRSLSL